MTAYPTLLLLEKRIAQVLLTFTGNTCSTLSRGLRSEANALQDGRSSKNNPHFLLKSFTFTANTYYQQKPQWACTDGHNMDNIAVAAAARKIKITRTKMCESTFLNILWYSTIVTGFKAVSSTVILGCSKLHRIVTFHPAIPCKHLLIQQFAISLCFQMCV